MAEETYSRKTVPSLDDLTSPPLCLPRCGAAWKPGEGCRCRWRNWRCHARRITAGLCAQRSSEAGSGFRRFSEQPLRARTDVFAGPSRLHTKPEVRRNENGSIVLWPHIGIRPQYSVHTYTFSCLTPFAIHYAFPRGGGDGPCLARVRCSAQGFRAPFLTAKFSQRLTC